MTRPKRIPIKTLVPIKTKRPRLPKAYLHYSTFDALCREAIRSVDDDTSHFIVFSASLKRAFVAKRSDEFVSWPGDLYEVEECTPFTKDWELAEEIEEGLDEDYYEKPASEKKCISECRDRFLCEIVIVSDDEPESISAVRI